jgi:hypothetical protein
VQRNVEVWQSLFSVRSLVVPMHEGGSAGGGVGFGGRAPFVRAVVLGGSGAALGCLPFGGAHTRRGGKGPRFPPHKAFPPSNLPTKSVPTKSNPEKKDVEGWLKFASLSRKSGRPRQAERMLVQLLRYDPRTVRTPHAPGYGAGSGAPAVMLAFVKHLWATGSREEALLRLQARAALVWGGGGRLLFVPPGVGGPNQHPPTPQPPPPHPIPHPQT